METIDEDALRKKVDEPLLDEMISFFYDVRKQVFNDFEAKFEKDKDLFVSKWIMIFAFSVSHFIHEMSLRSNNFEKTRDAILNFFDVTVREYINDPCDDYLSM